MATVSNLPTAVKRRPGRPYSSLASALAGSADEREVLVLLRVRLGWQLDSADMAAAPFAALLRQFRDVDAQIRAIDARAAEAAAAHESDDEDGDEAGWDPSKL